MKRFHIAPVTRQYLYRVGIAGVLVLVGYGAVQDQHALLWTGLLGTLLGMAERNTVPNG